MHDGMFRLLRHRRFLPLFVAQFLGAANDNLFKNALAVLIVYGQGRSGGLAPSVLVPLSAGLFILPYFLFSATAGQMADRYEKSRLMRLWKGLEVAVSAVGAWSLLTGSLAGMLAALFLLGVQAALYGPVKYAVLPELLKPDELVGGNALIEGGTFLAILAGTIAGGALILADGGPAAVAALSLGLAVMGFAAALAVPPARPGNPGTIVGAHIARETAVVLGLVWRRRDLTLAVLGISWFWLVGATYLGQFPAFARDVLAAGPSVVTMLLAMFSVGIGLGSVLCGRLTAGRLPVRPVVWAAVGMALFGADLWLAADPAAAVEPADLTAFLARPASWRILADLLAVAVCGGIYIVPLYVVLQSCGDPAVRSQVVAANNIVNAGFMVAAALASSGLLALGLAVPQLFLMVALANLAVAGRLRHLPAALQSSCREPEALS
jgi:acyl-[acyl-carrier-protein]-phospholipid O-acyltransferase/long-chain-fatty-acid--[acyl-carrier-protein] ligase